VPFVLTNTISTILLKLFTTLLFYRCFYLTFFLLSPLYFFVLPTPHILWFRFLKAAIDSQGGVDAGGAAAVLSPALQALLNQSDTRSLTDQMSEVSRTVLNIFTFISFKKICLDIIVYRLSLCSAPPS
jgi:hypothetical protein